MAQEFARQFPHRVSGLVLCATMCGGPHAIYMPPSIMRVMRELDGLEPEEIARRIWKVTYSPGYIEKHQESAEEQMRREIAAPTPLHATDLQFQALVEFDCSRALPNIRSPTLVLTGDCDQMVPPANSRIIANLIPGANLLTIPGCGHRVMWEATDKCVAFIAEFLANVQDGARLNSVSGPPAEASQNSLLGSVDFLTPAVNLYDMALDVDWSRYRHHDHRAAIDLFRKRNSVWRRQANYPFSGTRWQSCVYVSVELAQGARISARDDL